MSDTEKELQNIEVVIEHTLRELERRPSVKLRESLTLLYRQRALLRSTLEQEKLGNLKN